MLLLLVLHALLELSVLLLQSVNLVLHVLDPEILQADYLRQLTRQVGILVSDAC